MHEAQERKHGRHNWVRISIHKVLDVHTVGAEAKCKFNCTYTIHYVDKVLLRKAEYEAHAKSVKSMQRGERRIVRMGEDVVYGWMDTKNICKTKSPRGRINRLDVCEPWCEG